MKKIIALLLTISLAISLSGCYYKNTADKEEYPAFLETVSAKSDLIGKILPQLENTDCIDDVYLYYSDWDLLDSFYTIYLNCVYEPQQYAAEIQRLSELAEQLETEEDDGFFAYDSMIIDWNLELDETKTGIIHCWYILFDEANNRIVYTFIFDKELNGKSVNVPSEYLPAELVALRAAA